jgi:hypothetical protein
MNSKAALASLRRTLGKSPAFQYAINLKSEIPM